MLHYNMLCSEGKLRGSSGRVNYALHYHEVHGEITCLYMEWVEILENAESARDSCNLIRVMFLP